jgi:hypothetical protein
MTAFFHEGLSDTKRNRNYNKIRQEGAIFLKSGFIMGYIFYTWLAHAR